MQVRSHALEVVTRDVACVSTGAPNLPPGASHRRIEESAAEPRTPALDEFIRRLWESVVTDPGQRSAPRAIHSGIHTIKTPRDVHGYVYRFAGIDITTRDRKRTHGYYRLLE